MRFVSIWQSSFGSVSDMKAVQETRTPHQPKRKPRRGGNQSPGVYKGRRMTYAELIIEAINSTVEKRLTLKGIYEWMLR